MVQIFTSEAGRIFDIGAGLIIAFITASAVACAVRSWYVLTVTRLAIYTGSLSVLVLWGSNGGIMGHFTPTLAALPLVCALLLGSRDTIVFSVLLGIAIAMFYTFNGHLPEAAIAAENVLEASAATLVVMLLAVVLITVFLVRESEHREKKLRTLLEEQSHAATHDDLTGLPNRSAVREYLAGLDVDKDNVSILLIDLDGFKTVNDNYGHDAGDEVLIELAKVLKRVATDAALVARLGGDEFLVAFEERPDDPAMKLKGFTLGNRLADALDLTFEFDNSTCSISGSVGSACFPYDSEIGTEVKRKADIALYRAKHHGKSRHVRFYDGMIEQEASIRLKDSA